MPRLLRRLSPAGGALLVAAVVLTSGTAGAATGAALILGRSNTADRPTTLTNTGDGPALRLRAQSGPPFSVAGNDGRVHDLNADWLDGRNSRAFRALLLRGGRNDPDGGAAKERIYVVPLGVSLLRIELRGGGGAGGAGQPATGGGQGAFAEVVLSVKPGQLLALRPGDAGYAEGGFVAGTPGLGSVVTDVATKKRIAARGGAEGRRVGVLAGTCSAAAGGAGGDFVMDAEWGAGVTLLAVQDGRKGNEACAGNTPQESTDGAGGGVRGVAGSGGWGGKAGTSGTAGYILVTPLR